MNALSALLLLVLLSPGAGVAYGPKYRVLDICLATATALDAINSDESAADPSVVQHVQSVPGIAFPIKQQWEIREDEVSLLQGVVVRIPRNVPVLVGFNASRGEVSVDDGEFAAAVEQEWELEDGVLNHTLAFRPHADENAANAPWPVISGYVYDGQVTVMRQVEVIIVPVTDSIRITAPRRLSATYGTRALPDSARTARIIHAQLTDTKFLDPDATPLVEGIMNVTLSLNGVDCILERREGGWSQVIEEQPRRLQLRGTSNAVTFAVQNVHVVFNNQSAEHCTVHLHAVKAADTGPLEATAVIEIDRSVAPIRQVLRAHFTQRPSPMMASQGDRVEGFALHVGGSDLYESTWTVLFRYAGGSISSAAPSGGMNVSSNDGLTTSISGTLFQINEWISQVSTLVVATYPQSYVCLSRPWPLSPVHRCTGI